jgi:hypothetical protein
MDTQVIIVGAGPVGLTLAIETRRNFCPRWSGATPAPWKSTAAWGWRKKIRDAGFPREAPMDVFICHVAGRAAVAALTGK